MEGNIVGVVVVCCLEEEEEEEVYRSLLDIIIIRGIANEVLDGKVFPRGVETWTHEEDAKVIAANDVLDREVIPREVKQWKHEEDAKVISAGRDC